MGDRGCVCVNRKIDRMVVIGVLGILSFLLSTSQSAQAEYTYVIADHFHEHQQITCKKSRVSG